MVIRKFNKQKFNLKSVLMVGVLCFLAISAIVKIIRLQEQDLDLDNLHVPKLPSFSLGEHLDLSGNLRNENKFPHYTHLISNHSGEVFGLRSSVLNLNLFSGQLEIGGTMQEIYKSLPIIEVTYVKLASQHLIIKNNSYFFTKDLLRFDFDQQVGFSAERTGDAVQVYFEDRLLARFEPFVCNQVTKSQDCEQIINDLRYEDTEAFVSYDGYDYFRYGSGKRITFNNYLMGYIITPESDERLLDLSNATRIIDKSFVIKHKEEQMKSSCTAGDNKLVQIATYDYLVLDPQHVQMTIHGSSTDKYKVRCDIVFDLRENRKIDSAVLTGEVEK